MKFRDTQRGVEVMSQFMAFATDEAVDTVEKLESFVDENYSATHQTISTKAKRAVENGNDSTKLWVLLSEENDEAEVVTGPEYRSRRP